MSTSSSEKHFTSSILLWIRQDRPRQEGMDYWSGPHSGIIAATPGLQEYRQVHLAADAPGRWPAVPGLQTTIPEDRRVDGIAEVTFDSALAPLKGRAQTQKAYADEVNVFRRTLLYAGPPGSSRWHDVDTAAPVGARAVLFLRRSPDTSRRDFRALVRETLPPALADAADLRELRELRSQVFLPWSERTWDTPDVAHDNPREHRLHASVTVGFADVEARERFFTEAAPHLTDLLTPTVSAVHAYDVDRTLTFVEHGQVLDEPRR